MKRFYVLLLCCCAMLPSRQAFASHSFGADFYYTYLGGNTYSVTLDFYGDCGPGTAFNSLPEARPYIEVRTGNFLIDAFSLDLPVPVEGVEVTPVCPSQAGFTTCTNGSIPGVKRFSYTAVYTLPYESANWNFRFTGGLGEGSGAGRSEDITNMQIIYPGAGPGGSAATSIMVLECELNNVSGGNSSPRFTSIPTPFFCINLPQQYNPGSVDDDNDSLRFALTTALQEGETGEIEPVNYYSGYSATTPVLSSSFTFSAINGQMSFIPYASQKSIVVNKVTEYRDGVKVGSCMREMTFIVLPSCDNNPPAAFLSESSGITGGTLEGTSIINVCQGTPVTSFTLFPLDADAGSNVTVSAAGVPAAATITISNNGTTNPEVFFSLPTGALLPGLYTFFLTYADDGCPLSSRQTQAYTIRILTPPSVAATIATPTNCNGDASVQFLTTGSTLPREITAVDEEGVVRTFTDSSGSFFGALPPGTYTLTVRGIFDSCTSVSSITVVDSGIYPFAPEVAPAEYCLGAIASPLMATVAPGGVLQWYETDGTALGAAPTPNTSIAGVYQWLVGQQVGVCPSVVDTVTAYVTVQPVAAITLSETLICSIDSVLVTATGAVGSGPVIRYLWDWDEAIYVSDTNAGPNAVLWSDAGVKTISLTVIENGCASEPVSASLQIKPTPATAFTVQDGCAGDILQVMYTEAPLDGQSYVWTFEGGSPETSTSGGVQNIVWNQPGTFNIKLVAGFEGCADSETHTVLINPDAEADITNEGGAACYGDIVYLQATGGVSYQWLPITLLATRPDDGRLYVRILEPVTIGVIATNAFGCTDEDSIRIQSVERCCTFAYPNAFTPDGDGINDRFQPLLRGNELSWDFSIYNRWGQRVFRSFNASDSWDGTFEGKDCEIGTYYYRLNAQCLTGPTATTKGDVTLIR